MSTPQPTDAQVSALLGALRKLPGHPGITYRGIGEDASFGTREGAAVVTRGLVASSRDIRVATENSTASGLYVISGTTGRAIEQFSTHPTEREVVFPPSTLFRAVCKARLGDLPVVIVEQLDPACPPAAPAAEQEVEPWPEWLRTAAEAHRAALTMPPVEITSPGKFVGDID